MKYFIFFCYFFISFFYSDSIDEFVNSLTESDEFKQEIKKFVEFHKPFISFINNTIFLDYRNGRLDYILVFQEDGFIKIQVNQDTNITMKESFFKDVFCKHFQFKGFDQIDSVFLNILYFENRYYEGYAITKLKIPYAQLKNALIPNQKSLEAFYILQALTDFGDIGCDLNNQKALSDGIKKAKLCSFRVADGSGTLIKYKERYFVLTAKHVLGSVDRTKIPVSNGGQVFLMKVIKEQRKEISGEIGAGGGKISPQEYDYAILEFSQKKEEEQAKRSFGGIELLQQNLNLQEFVFLLGYPNSWPDNNNHKYKWDHGEKTIEPNTKFNLVLTTGILLEICSANLEASCRSGNGNSGGGLFVFGKDNIPYLVGILHSSNGFDRNQPLNVLSQPSYSTVTFVRAPEFIFPEIE